MSTPNVLIIGGISGSGKGTVCDKLVERHGFVRPVSVTTRVPRPGERFGDHYFFVSKELFQWLVETEQLLEHTDVWSGHLYGTLKLSVDQSLAQGKTVLFELNTHGIEQVTKLMPQVKTVFIKAPSEAEQRIRLEMRGTVGAEQDERVTGAATELAIAEKMSLPIVVNDDLGKALEEIEQAFGITE